MNIYIAKSGQQTGPFSEAQVESMLKSGTISLTDLAWHDGLSAWIPLHQVLNVSPPVPQPIQPLPISATGGEAPNRMFLYIPIGRLVAMSIVSLGLYEVYWIYRNWRYLKERDGLKIWPFWRAVLGIFFIYPLLETIKTDPTTNRIVPARFSPGPLATGWIILVLLGNLASHASEPVVSFIGILLSVPSFCFLIPVQRHINALNEALPVRPSYYPWSAGHIVCLVLGIIFWLLILVGLIQ